MARLRVMSVSIAYDGHPVSAPPQPKLMQLWYQKMVAGYFARWLPANAPVPEDVRVLRKLQKIR